MFKVDSAGATVDNEFTDGDPGTATPATVVPAEWLNAVQAELLAPLTAASIAPDKEDSAQLLAAMNALFLKLTGGVLTDYLTLHSDPTDDMHAATKQFVLAQVTPTPDASTTVKGKVELATVAETKTGTSEVLAVTPDGFAAASLGYEQSWQDVTGSRAATTNYQNTSGKPIEISIMVSGANRTASIGVSTGTMIAVSQNGASNSGNLHFIVPPNHYYSCDGSFTKWHELR